MKYYSVKFIRGAHPYTSGDIAVFSERFVKRFIDLGAVKILKVFEKGEDRHGESTSPKKVEDVEKVELETSEEKVKTPSKKTSGSRTKRLRI